MHCKSTVKAPCRFGALTVLSLTLHYTFTVLSPVFHQTNTALNLKPYTLNLIPYTLYLNPLTEKDEKCDERVKF